MSNNKIIVHLGNEVEYRSFIRNLYDNNENLDLLGTNCHNNLFDIYYQNKPDFMIFCTSEYTQEIHDFITEHNNKKPRIILFLNSRIDNPEIIDFWNKGGVIVTGKSEYVGGSLASDNTLIYQKLYDSKLYKSMPNKERNDKIAVLLSDNDQKNSDYLKDILYPKTKEKLVLFNSTTYIQDQNVGLLNPMDLCIVLNTYKALLDLDDKYDIEASVCGIDDISTNGNIADNIMNMTKKSNTYNINELSYDFFIKNTFLPLIRGLT